MTSLTSQTKMNSNGKENPQFYTFPPSSVGVESAPSPKLCEVGGKALSLYESSETFPVPPGLVLTVAFFQPWLEQIENSEAWKDFVNKETMIEKGKNDRSNVSAMFTKEDCDAIKSKCREVLTLNSDQRQILDEAIQLAFGSGNNDAIGRENSPKQSDNLGIVAVRSSSPEEDLAESSFAGGYETTLGVTSATLHDAILTSFESMFDQRVFLYKQQHHEKATNSSDTTSPASYVATLPRIAVIIQRQIASDVSGVGFSINPSNNCYDEIMISANFGLGESVVGGIVTPDTYVVDRFDPKEKEFKIVSKNVANKTSAIWLDSSSGGTRQEENKEPNAQVLSDDQILEVANLVARVEKEERYGGAFVDIEWAFHNETLYLLQARPVTSYIPVFPEMITERGDEKRLYLDIMVYSQGFSDPLSTLGLDLWKTILARMKPTFSTEGKDGLVWNLHGREYFNISNMLKTTGGSAMVDKAFRSHSKSVDRALDSIDLKEYTPSVVPNGSKGIMWKSLTQLWNMLPNIIQGLYKGDKSMDEYVTGSNAIFEACHDDNCSKDEPFDDAYENLMSQYNKILPCVGSLVAGLISRFMLHRMFSKCEGAEDDLISMCMDLNGNPTSEMGHFMVRLASYTEIQETKTSEEFLDHLEKDGGSSSHFSEDFLSDYRLFLRKFGCRGIREIDAATPRTYENQGALFDTLKQIDINQNQIINVRERREKAYQKLLSISKEIGREKQFVHHAGIVQSLLGYREHPKYMLVVMIDRMRRHALNIAEDFVAKGRLDNKDQIFSLTIEQIAEAQRCPHMKLRPLVEADLNPRKKVAHIKNWPVLIDSRGKIIQGKRKDMEAEEGTFLGDPISPGIARGRAKVLMSPHEKPLESGEILVARFTEPSWTPLFINTAGVVMEVGGPLQHGAVIAREYGIPCVSGLDNATTLISDGDFIEVDGSAVDQLCNTIFYDYLLLLLSSGMLGK